MRSPADSASAVLPQRLAISAFREFGNCVEATKQRCADLGIDYGRADGVSFNVNRLHTNEWHTNDT